MIENQSDFNQWMSQQLSNSIPEQVIAFAINIYESPFKIELIGSDEFTRDNDDWACDEVWVPDNRQIAVSSVLFGSRWQDAEQAIINLASNFYHSDQPNAYKLKFAQGFAVGFVDGSLNYI